MMNLLLKVIFEFFKTGLFAIGGGLVTVPFFNEMAVNYGWFTTDTLYTIIAISQSMPGPIGINMAVYAGCVTFDSFFGGIVTSLSLVFPSIVIVVIVARMLKKFKENRFVQRAFYGIRPAVVALIASACVSLFLKALLRVDLFEQTGNVLDIFNFFHLAIFAIMLTVYYKVKIKGKNLSPIVFIVASACIGIVFQL